MFAHSCPSPVLQLSVYYLKIAHSEQNPRRPRGMRDEYTFEYLPKNVERGVQLSLDRTPEIALLPRNVMWLFFRNPNSRILASCLKKNWHVYRKGDNYGIKNQKRGHARNFKTKMLTSRRNFLMHEKKRNNKQAICSGTLIMPLES